MFPIEAVVVGLMTIFFKLKITSVAYVLDLFKEIGGKHDIILGYDETSY